MSKYTTQAKIEAYLQRSLTDQEIIILPLAITSASNLINNYTNRLWYDVPQDSEEDQGIPEESVRIYDGNNQQEINIDDVSDISKIEILDSAGGIYATITNTNDYVGYPHNADYISSIYLRGYRVPSGAGRLRVTGIFGAGPAPEDVQLLATVLSAKFLSNIPNSTSDKKSESIEGYSVTYRDAKTTDEENKQLLMTLDHYKRIFI